MNHQYKSRNLFGDLTNAATIFTNIPLMSLQDADQSIAITLGVGVDAGLDAYVANLKHSSGVFKIPEKLSKMIFVSDGPTLTGQWMDGSGKFNDVFSNEGIQTGCHRMHRHHLVDDALTVYQNKELSVLDFYKHLATDIPTKAGIPLLPKDAILSIADTLGVSASKVVPWVSFNLVDAGTSIFSFYHAAGNVVSVVSGNAHWGVPYAIDTFGAGAAEIAGGVFSRNPILIASGTVDVGCGVVSAYKHYSEPAIFGVNAFDLLHSIEISAGLSAILALAEVVVARDNLSAAEQIKKVTKRMSISSSSSFLSAVSQPLGIVTSVSYSSYHLAKAMAQRTDKYIGQMSIFGDFANELDRRICENMERGITDRMLSYLDGLINESSNILLRHLK